MSDNSCKIVRHAASPGQNVIFEWRIPTTDLHLATPGGIAIKQDAMGYPPQGYGGPFNIKMRLDDTSPSYIVSWECWGSCD